MDYRTFIPLIAAVLLAGIAFGIARRWAASFSVQRSAAGRIETFADQERPGMIDRLGDTLAGRLGLRIEAWRHELRWAQLGGRYLTSAGHPKTVGSVLGQSVVFGLVGLVYIILLRAYSPIYWIVVALAAYSPYMTLRSRAGTVREAVKRGLPETAALVAAEMNAGNSITLAVERASLLPGPTSLLLREAVERARSAGALLFSQAGVQGVIVRHFSELRFPPLEAFAARMDAVAERGAEGPQRMNELARDLAMEYQVTVARSAETLDNKLLTPMTIFFFVPFMAAIFIPLMASLFSAF